MKEELIVFETAKLAKEKGFDWDCESYYKPNTKELPSNLNGKRSWNHVVPAKEYYSAPTQSLLQKWLREKHNIHIPVNWVYKKSYDTDVDWHYNVKGIGLTSNNLIDLDETKFNTYEKALEVGLLEALKLIK
jgi:hypothetical protein